MNNEEEIQDQIRKRHESIEYNDRMTYYMNRYNRVKDDIMTCSLSSGGVLAALLLFEIYNSWDPYKAGMGVGLTAVFSVICMTLTVIIIKKLVPKLFLFIAAVSLVFALVSLSLVPVFYGVMNAAFFFVTRRMDRIKEWEGYPYFAKVKVRDGQ